MRKLVSILLFLTTAVASCTGSKGGGTPTVFPEGFLWGVSTAAEQSEGGNTQNDWYVWEQMNRAPRVGLADNMYSRYAQDFTDVQAMHLNAFRLTFEWSRIVPDRPTDVYAPLTAADISWTAVQHYTDVVDSLIAHGLTPVVTLTHYTVPIWVDNPLAYDPVSRTFTDGSLGGWTNTATAYAFASYAGFMARQFSATVRYWLTENEPLQVALGGYTVGVLPPGFFNISSLTAATMPFSASVVTVLRNMVMGHVLAYHAIHAAEPGAMVSIAKSGIFTSAVPGSQASAAAARSYDHAYNLDFLDAVTRGVFDDGLTGTTFTEVHPEWADTLDYIGVNYYSNDYIVPAQGLLSPVNAIPCDPSVEAIIPLSAFGCPAQGPSETQGLTDMVIEYAKRYHLPVLVTENGSNSADPLEKAKYIVRNVAALHDAIDRGADVLGYMYWTLDYDYEWTSGYRQNFGLFYVDDFSATVSLPAGMVPTQGTDFARTPVQPAVDVYSAIAAGNGISPAIMDQYGQ